MHPRISPNIPFTVHRYSWKTTTLSCRDVQHSVSFLGPRQVLIWRARNQYYLLSFCINLKKKKRGVNGCKSLVCSQTQCCEQLAVRVSGSLLSAQSIQLIFNKADSWSCCSFNLDTTCLLVQSCLNLFCAPFTVRWLNVYRRLVVKTNYLSL